MLVEEECKSWLMNDSVAFLSECGKMSALPALRQSVTNKESLRPARVHHQTQTEIVWLVTIPHHPTVTVRVVFVAFLREYHTSDTSSSLSYFSCKKLHQKCMQHCGYHRLSTSLVMPQSATDCFCIYRLKCSKAISGWVGWNRIGSLNAPML